MLVYIILGITLIYVAVIIYLYLKSERSVQRFRVQKR